MGRSGITYPWLMLFISMWVLFERVTSGMFVTSQQACFELTIDKSKHYYDVAKQDTADCVLENGECALTYTGKAAIGLVGFVCSHLFVWHASV